MELLYQDILQAMQHFLLPFFRILAVMMIAPGIGSHMISKKIRVTFSVTIAVLIFLHVPQHPPVDWLSLKMGILVFREIVIGIAIGFIFQMLIQTAILSGQIIAMQNGLGFASMVDPMTKMNIPVLSQLYSMLVTLLFFAMNGHLLVLDSLIQSFHLLPIAGDGLSQSGLWQLLMATKSIFSVAIVMALPAVTSLLLVNLGFGIMTRAAPQLNIFAVGFPVTLTLGMVVIYLTISGTVPHIEGMLTNNHELVRSILTAK